MKFVSYDPENDEITLLQKGDRVVRCLLTYIGSGEVDRLPREERGKLYEQIKGHPKVVADQGAFGCFSFHLVNQQNLFLVLFGLYVGLLVLCPVLFMWHSDIMGLNFTGGSIVFPFTYVLLDCISELYGFRRARQTLVYTGSLLMLFGGALALQDHFLEGFIHGDHSNGDQQAVNFFYKELPKNFFLLGLSIVLTDLVNILLFHWIRHLMNNRWFWFRSLVSTTVALTIFSVVGPLVRFPGFWNDPETLDFVINVTKAKYPLVLVYVWVGVAIVELTRYWRRNHAKY